MTENTENLETPKWLQELEKKRENRLKARLGHEAGAGAPCIKCEDKCPGLDLHFWRKICKNCKCLKEDHDVHDDDIYGWAEFQLLGSKPNKIKKKIVLPGKKDEVELDWTPKGNTETIDRYLKTLAPETLPVKGSQAAQDRKQLLQKQIPIHDLDPYLCHALTDSEFAKMQDYIKHMKNSAGVGQIIQFNVNHGNKHIIGETNVKLISDRYPKGVPSTETVHLIGGRTTGNLTKQLEKLTVQDQKELDAFFDKIPKPHNMTAHGENLGYNNMTATSEKIGYVPKFEQTSDKISQNYSETQNQINPNPRYATPLDNNPNYSDEPPPLPKTLPPRLTEINQNINPTFNFARDHEVGGVLASHGADPPYTNQIPGDTQYVYPTDPISTNQKLGDPKYANQVNFDPKYGYGAGPNYEINRNLPHYAPGKMIIHNDQQTLIAVGNLRDISHGTHDLTNSNYNKTLPGYNPNQFNVPENQLVPNEIRIGAIRDINYDVPEIKTAVQGQNKMFEGLEAGGKVSEDVEIHTQQCRKCSKFFEIGEFAIFAEKLDALYHSDCFKCAGCNQNLADLFYFHDKETDNLYCGRDFAKIRGIPRCKACDELIFVKEYCLAENSTFHLKHFCCFECDTPLAGQNYVLEDSQPICVPCYEKLKASKCTCCGRVIKPDEPGVALSGNTHFHAEECFACSVCKKSLHGARLLFKNEKLYCSHECFRSDK